MFKHNLDRLLEGMRSLLDEDRYSFSETDKALLEEILKELEEISTCKEADGGKQVFDVLSLILRYLKFFGIENVSDLF